MQSIQKVINVCAVVVLAVGLLGGLSLALRGAQARPPGKLETQIMTLAKHRLLVGSAALTNPSPATAENITEGRENFSHYCFACHGLDGQNTGVPFSEAMSPPVPSLASKEVQSYTDGQLYWVIRNGLFPSGMPAAHGILTDEEMWSIVIYIRHLPPAGRLGEPPAYSGEDCNAAGEQADQTPASQATQRPKR